MKVELLHITADPLIKYFKQFVHITEEEALLVSTFFKPRRYRKRQYVLQEGDICNHFNFILHGCLRLYKLDKLGNTHILEFSAENTWMSNIGSFQGLTASELIIDALEDTVVLQITHDNLLLLYKKAVKFDHVFRIIIENSYVTLQNLLLQNISNTAEERYDTFLKGHRDLANRLSQIHIAAFLGITPEFLSRLRNRRAKK